jgi:DnaJ-class molecular chaperone
MSENFYTTLGVSRDATQKQIKDAYRRLAREHHPDVNPGDNSAEERFKRINEASHVLSDTQRRKDYDEFGSEWEHAERLREAGAGARFRGGHGGFGFNRTKGGGFEDIFSQFGFGGGTGSQRKRGRDSQTLSINITLNEAYSGAKRVISYRRTEDCGVCGGQGFRRQTVCANCGGTGQTDRPVRLEVSIPAGIDDQGKVRVRPDPNTEILVQIQIRADNTFTRSGSDLRTTVSVPYLDAILGGEVMVPTMTGSVALTVPVGTPNDKVFRLAGKGMPRQGSNDFGTLYATISVVLPADITEEEQTLFKQLKTLATSQTVDESVPEPTD